MNGSKTKVTPPNKAPSPVVEGATHIDIKNPVEMPVHNKVTVERVLGHLSAPEGVEHVIFTNAATVPGIVKKVNGKERKAADTIYHDVTIALNAKGCANYTAETAKAAGIINPKFNKTDQLISGELVVRNVHFDRLPPAALHYAGMPDGSVRMSGASLAADTERGTSTFMSDVFNAIHEPVNVDRKLHGFFPKPHSPSTEVLADSVERMEMRVTHSFEQEAKAAHGNLEAIIATAIAAVVGGVLFSAVLGFNRKSHQQKLDAQRTSDAGAEPTPFSLR